jgi:hypothetical protein
MTSNIGGARHVDNESPASAARFVDINVIFKYFPAFAVFTQIRG